MNVDYIPGTTLPNTDKTASAFSYIEPLLSATGGLSLSQVCAITGLEGSTIQNWVKRGWISKPTMKKYDEIQVSRILIINALRDSLSLEQITGLLSFVNGSVTDISDDIIRESQLFNYLCEAVKKLDISSGVSLKKIMELVKTTTASYVEPVSGAAGRLHKTMVVMVTGYLSGYLKREADQFIKTFL